MYGSRKRRVNAVIDTHSISTLTATTVGATYTCSLLTDDSMSHSVSEIETTHHHKLDHGRLEPLIREGIYHREILTENPHDQVQLIAVGDGHTNTIQAPPHRNVSLQKL